MRERYSVGLWKAIKRWWPLLGTRLSFVVGKEQRVVLKGGFGLERHP